MAGFVWASPHQPDVVGRAVVLWAVGSTRPHTGGLQGGSGSSPCTRSLARGRADRAGGCAHIAILMDVAWIRKSVLEVSLSSGDFSTKPFWCNSTPGWQLSPGKLRLYCLALLIQDVFNGRGAVCSPLGDLSSCKAPAVYTNFSVRVNCFLETKKPQVPTVSKEMGKERRAWDRVQLHLSAAAKLYARVGHALSTVRIHTGPKKSRDRSARRGFGASESA